jgi:6-phosphogluconolactonase
VTQHKEIIACADADDLADRAADWLVSQLGGRCGPRSVCLSGGSTPKRLYARLARDPWRASLAWPDIHWFFGDERVVPPDDARSNLRMAREALLDVAPVPRENIHAVPTGLRDADACAAAYQETLEGWHGSRVLGAEPLFDIILLGIGSDGHTASLFPGTKALEETERWVVGNEPGLDPFVPRVTLTFPAIASSRAVVFLVSGADKRDILAKVLAGGDYPASRVTQHVPTLWFVDEAAYPSPS